MLITFVCNSISGQNIKEIIKYIENQSGYKIDSYSTSITGNYDYESPKLVTDMTISGSIIWDLKILDTFPRLKFLRIIESRVNRIINLPSSVNELMINDSKINSKINIPSNVKKLIFVNNNTDLFPNILDDLAKLDISRNKFTKVEYLPKNLIEFDCSENQFKKLPNLPPNLKSLRCAKNNIKSLPDLPLKLESIDCSFNKIESFNTLPIGLKEIDFSGNQIAKISDLPNNLKELNLIDNPIKKLPKKIKKPLQRILPTYLNQKNDYRDLLLGYKSKCPLKFKNISNKIYKSFINYDFEAFVTNSINLNDFSWISKSLEGDSISKMNELKTIINEEILTPEEREVFFEIARDIDQELLLLDRIEVSKKVFSEFIPYKTYMIKFYFKKLGHDVSDKYLNFDLIDSPRGFLWTYFSSNLKDLKLNENKPLNRRPLPDKLPEDFEISIFKEHDYRFNSGQGIYKKALTGKGSICKVNLTKQEKKLIYSILKETNFNNLEKDIRGVNTFSITSISIKYLGVREKVFFKDVTTDEYKKLGELIEVLDKILKNKKRVKKLPERKFIAI